MTGQAENLRLLFVLAMLGLTACVEQASTLDREQPTTLDAQLAVADASADTRPSAVDAASLDAGTTALDAATTALDAATTAVDGPDRAPRDANVAAPERPPADPDKSLGAGATATETGGQPLPGLHGEWTYTEFPDTQCRDGAPTGIAVNLGSSNKLMIYLGGGGWCVDEESCKENLNSTDAQAQILALGLIVGAGGVFDRENQDNPVRDWNFVYVPYCTGDLHGGATPDGDVPGVGPQRFVGYLNMTKFLRRLVPTFQNASDLLLVGSSAGGFGALFNSVQVQRAFSTVKLKTISDSAPPLSKAVFATCLQARARRLFGLDKTILAECGAACPDPNAFVEDFALHLAKTFGDRPGGLIESAQDVGVRAYLGTGGDDCTAPLDAENPGLSGPALRAALLAFRERVKPFPEYGTFYPDDAQHTWLPGVFRDDFYTVRVAGMRLVDWFAKIVNGQAAGHAGPE